MLDAVISPRVPSSYGDGRARRLLSNYVEQELQYFRSTGIFPPMHVVALRTDLYERYPWVARSVYDAYQRSKREAYAWLADINALPISIPWYVPAYEQTQDIFGSDPWTDGLEPNREALETLVRYLNEQRLAMPVELDAMFAPNTCDEYVV